ncbi:carboxymuconolactone decarboxylase family protein [Novosphingobium mangrovi (ex Hu et al. 2023)]|uniref:Carboxymuconolactone decarboxylase family protein n=1 Tax=Novosphingobium mangrovi (ex Hu et al. 2023) TaxID=2930094 RepID=A0ABT0A817_9SPHN|nr:carboxymuconolactone decarboxylase family protein [Novosphingobium mangrovi (ex Hu et al. 2023)]MCJ1959308.1 carboxymuconolactone decarboxylase family protein [Novosphingobium mangrovi (ex Hu et al. 2023)]
MNKHILAAAAAVAMPGAASAAESVAPDYMQRAAPALARYTDNVLFGDVWKREELSPRDRSVVTLSVLVSTGKSAQIRPHLERALDNGVTPTEIGGLITQLAFYSGWPNAFSAVQIADEVFQERGIDASAIQPATTPLNDKPANDGQRESAVNNGVGQIAPTLGEMTNEVLFNELWLRQDLAARDRSLVTIVALTASGDADQLGFHLQRGIENGLTKAELGAAMGHLAFYAGWPKAFSGATALGKLGNGN